jgi:hypothetical protein
MKSYSPIDNIRRTAYPNILLTGGAPSSGRPRFRAAHSGPVLLLALHAPLRTKTTCAPLRKALLHAGIKFRHRDVLQSRQGQARRRSCTAFLWRLAALPWVRAQRPQLTLNAMEICTGGTLCSAIQCWAGMQAMLLAMYPK